MKLLPASVGAPFLGRGPCGASTRAEGSRDRQAVAKASGKRGGRAGSGPTAEEAALGGCRARRHRSRFPWASLPKGAERGDAKNVSRGESLARQRRFARESIAAREAGVCWKPFPL